MLPSKDQLTICFAHVAYRLGERFLTLATHRELRGARRRRARAADRRGGRAGGLGALVQRPLAAREATALHSVDRRRHRPVLAEPLKQHGVRLASARGVNARAVSEHVMALMLALARRLPEARDNQAKLVWRGMIGDFTQRERARRQDAAHRRPRTDRRPARTARQGVRHARARHPLRPARQCRTRGCGALRITGLGRSMSSISLCRLPR